jgi:flagellar M-ring protein FliF
MEHGTWVPLQVELELGQIGEVEDQLSGAGIPYRLGRGGAEVQVDASRLAEAQVLLARDGHAFVGRPGLELFDQSSWGMTDFTQRVTFRRALEGELVRTIRSLDGIENAYVHLALPEASALRRMERPAEAAVVLETTAGTHLSPDVVRGIAQLVSNSVEQLTPDNVAVLDDAGRLLSSNSGDNSTAGLTAGQLGVQQSVEAHLASKAEEILRNVVGDGNYRVQVSALLNFEQVDRTVRSYDPDGSVVASEDIEEGGTDATGLGGGTHTVNKYLNSETVERTVGSVGGIERLTVAVLVNEQALLAQASDDPTRARQQLGTLDSLVRTAVGINVARGDLFTLSTIPFETAPTVNVADLVQPPAPTADIMTTIERFLRPGMGAIGILLLFALAWRVLRTGDGEMSSRREYIAALEAPQQLAPLTPAPEELNEAQQLRKEILSGSSLPPETAAQVIRAWMAES